MDKKCIVWQKMKNCSIVTHNCISPVLRSLEMAKNNSETKEEN